jgi:anti-anti-sigma factor
MPLADPSVPFRLDVIPERARVRVAPAGELDIATVPELERTIGELVEAGFDHIVVDLENVEFLDSTALQLILSVHAGADAGGYRLRLRPGPPAVQRIFELTRTLERLDFELPLRALA